MRRCGRSIGFIQNSLGRPLILSPQIDLRGGCLSGRRCLFFVVVAVVAGGLRIAKFGCAVANNGVGSYSTTRLVSGPYAPMNWAPQSPLSGRPAALSYINQSHSTTLTIIGHWLMKWPAVSFLVSGLCLSSSIS